eukprot:673636-Pleurochrysis_carterae.AAC.1
MQSAQARYWRPKVRTNVSIEYSSQVYIWRDKDRKEIQNKGQGMKKGIGEQGIERLGFQHAPPPGATPQARPAPAHAFAPRLHSLYCNITSVFRPARTVTLQWISVKIQNSQLYTPVQAYVVPTGTV